MFGRVHTAERRTMDCHGLNSMLLHVSRDVVQVAERLARYAEAGGIASNDEVV
jgi:hypothetical protein